MWFMLLCFVSCVESKRRKRYWDLILLLQDWVKFRFCFGKVRGIVPKLEGWFLVFDIFLHTYFWWIGFCMTAARFSSVKFSHFHYTCELSHKVHLFSKIFIFICLCLASSWLDYMDYIHPFSFYSRICKFFPMAVSTVRYLCVVQW